MNSRERLRNLSHRLPHLAGAEPARQSADYAGKQARYLPKLRAHLYRDNSTAFTPYPAASPRAAKGT